MLEVGDKVPAFALEQTDGSKVKSTDWMGQTTALYFYPKDFTTG